MSTNKAGTQVVTVDGDTVTVDYEYNDRGRGPKTHNRDPRRPGAVPLSLETTGNDYYKVPIEERFSTESGQGRWKNTSESGQGPAGAFYSSMYGPPEELALLARALLRNGNRRALFPAGEATIRNVDEKDLHGTRVTAYELSGLGFTPSEIWLDADRNLFGAVSAWQSTIREGSRSTQRRSSMRRTCALPRGSRSWRRVSRTNRPPRG